MLRRKIGHLMVASSFVFAMLGAGSAIAYATDTTTPGTDLANEVQAGEQGEPATANDDETAEDIDEDDEVEDVDEHDVADVPAEAAESSTTTD